MVAFLFFLALQAQGLSVERKIEGLNENGLCPFGTRELTFTLTFSKTVSGTFRLDSWEDVLPSGWTYEGGSLASTVMPTSVPEDGNSGTIRFSWTSMQTFPLTMSYTVNIPDNYFYPANIKGNLYYSSRLFLGRVFWIPNTRQDVAEVTINWWTPTVAVQNSGGLSVFLAPAEAVSAGARWRLSGGDWKESGATITDLASGIHKVEFIRVTGWQPIKNHYVVVASGKTETLEANYSPETGYLLGNVPPVTVRYGESAIFHVYTGDGATLSCTVNGSPVNRPTFDSATGQFEYTPAAEDREAFSVTFSTSGSITASQTVPVQPIARLLPEEHILTYKRDIPKPHSKDYLTVTEVKNPTPEPFNNQNLNTRAVTISGKTVVIEKGFPDNGLYEQYHGRPDIKIFTVYAETLILRSPLELPQTEVTVYARELRFEDKPGQPQASLCTTPRHISSIPAQFQQGKPGLKAGDIHLFIERFHADAGASQRLILTGGKGQEGGPGKPGGKGIDITPVGYPFSGVSQDVKDNCTYYKVNMPSYLLTAGDPNNWKPGDGKNATPGGKPGNGGAGGNMDCTLDLRPYTNTSGGAAGKVAATQPGGSAGKPVPAYYLTGYYTSPTVTTHTAKAGTSAPGPLPDKPVGDRGSFTPVPSITAWFHPYVLRPILLHAKDAYINGNLDYVQSLLEEYLGLLELCAGDIPADLANELIQLRTEMENLRSRIANGLDYFGNPPGWVPMLSFEANYAKFEQEIKSSIPILYLAYCLNAADKFTGDRIAALSASRDKIREEITSFTEKYNAAQSLIPSLQTESENISNEIERLQTRLIVVENRLIKKAENNVNERHKVPWWKKACRVASFVCKLIPDPTIQAIGIGLDIALNFDANKPLATIGQIQNAFNGFDSSKIAEDAANFKAKLKELDPSNVTPENAREYFDNLSSVAKELSGKLTPLKNMVATNQAPKNEVEVELQKLKSTDPEFNQIVKDLQEFNLRKEVFAAKLAEATNVVSYLANGITQNLLAVNEISEAISSSLNARNHSAMVYVKEMEARARERLLRYQYDMAKAYEYRMLKPYSGSFKLDTLFDQFVLLLNQYPNELGLSDWSRFENASKVYQDELQQVAYTIYNQLNSNAPERTAQITFTLLPDEIKQLNNDGKLSINLMERCRFPEDRENVRIVDIETDNLQAELEGDPRGQAVLSLEYLHSGLSCLESNGEFYQFNHYRTSSVNPITWGIDYDLVAGTKTPTLISAASGSLLRFLLNRAGVADPEMLLYSRPAAWTEIHLVRSVSTAGVGVRIPITDLRIKVSYDYYRKSSETSSLFLEVPEGLTPFIALDKSDKNGRSNGRGSFYRTYSRNSTVKLTPQSDYGELEFSHWEDGSGVPLKSVEKAGSLTIVMNNHKRIRAVYTYKEPRIVVPNVVGKQRDEAETALNDATFFLEDVSFTGSAVYPTGQVISQEPAAGSQQPAGTSISLLVSSGLQPVVVPDTVGEQSDSAKILLQNVGLRPGQVIYQNLKGIPKGSVFAQLPPADTRVAPGSPVILIVVGADDGDGDDGWESDVAPRPDGDGNMLVNDWVQVGRFVAGLDQAAPGSEFQRADCAPIAPLGDGQLLVNDWVQAGRYVAGLDAPQAAGGPTSP